MKKYLLILVAAIFFVPSCAVIDGVLDDPRTTVEKSLPYVSPASYFATQQVLSYSVDEEDRRKKAEVLYSIAGAVRSLSDGQVPTVQELENVIRLASPDKPHWIEFTAQLNEVYGNIYNEITNDQDKKLILDIIGELAEGIERAAEPYVSPDFLFEYKIEVVAPFELKRL